MGHERERFFLVPEKKHPLRWISMGGPLVQTKPTEIVLKRDTYPHTCHDSEFSIWLNTTIMTEWRYVIKKNTLRISTPMAFQKL